MNNEHKLTVYEQGERLDKYISVHIDGITRTRAVSLIENGFCTVNNRICNKNYKVMIDDRIVVNITEDEPHEIIPENIPLNILHEDDSFIIINKPRGMVVHPSIGHTSGTLVNALMWHYDKLSEVNCKDCCRPGIVHRLDKDTSGLISIAKNDVSHLSLAQQLKDRTALREYEAIVCGRVKLDNNTINAPIGRSVSDRKKMCVTTKNSREALTYCEVVERFDKFTHVRLRLCTGRTHQIRVHMAYIGHPVAGDIVYGDGKPKLLGGQCLHSKKLGFAYPDGEYKVFDSVLPDYFTDFLLKLKK